MIGLQHYLTVSAMLFVLAIAGIVVNRRNSMSVEDAAVSVCFLEFFLYDLDFFN